MANAAEKKRNANNLAMLSQLRLGALLAHALYVLVRVLYFYSSMTFWVWAGFLSTSAMTGLAYFQLTVAHRSGVNITMQGSVCEYFQDVVYVGIFITAVASFVDRAYYLWLVVLVFASYKLWTSLIAPWLFAPGPSMDLGDQPLSKKQLKAQRREEKLAKRNGYRR